VVLVTWFAALLAIDAFTPLRLEGPLVTSGAPGDPADWRSWWAVVGMSVLVLPASVAFWGVVMGVWAKVVGARRARFAVALAAAVHVTAVELAGMTGVAAAGLAGGTAGVRLAHAIGVAAIAAYGIALALAGVRSLGMARAPAFAFAALAIIVQSMGRIL